MKTFEHSNKEQDKLKAQHNRSKPYQRNILHVKPNLFGFIYFLEPLADTQYTFFSSYSNNIIVVTEPQINTAVSLSVTIKRTILRTLLLMS